MEKRGLLQQLCRALETLRRMGLQRHKESLQNSKSRNRLNTEVFRVTRHSVDSRTTANVHYVHPLSCPVGRDGAALHFGHSSETAQAELTVSSVQRPDAFPFMCQGSLAPEAPSQRPPQTNHYLAMPKCLQIGGKNTNNGHVKSSTTTSVSRRKRKQHVPVCLHHTWGVTGSNNGTSTAEA